MDLLLEMKGITKRFPGVLANDGVDFEVRRGEVHALLGENGAGKSTLMGILYGLIRPNAGEIRWAGSPVRIRSPRNALDLGIGMVHQHFMLVPALRVVENLVLGLPAGRGPFLDLSRAAARLAGLSQTYGLKVDPWARVADLSVGEQQRVEIIKALFRSADLLILDEPTAVLTPQETEELFGIIRRLRSEGHAVVFISHKLNEVLAISDRITVLRAGRVVGTVAARETTRDELARLMVGREVSAERIRKAGPPGATVLEVKGLEVRNRRGLPAVRGVSLEVHQGEILGIAGVDGNGQNELVEAIAGLAKVHVGQVRVNGADVTNAAPRAIYERGVGHIPGDRQGTGLVVGLSIQENLVLSTYYLPPFRKGPFLDWMAIANQARELVAEFDVKCPGVGAPVRTLSGGNQQKLILARELSRKPDLLLAVHPTHGLDVGATQFVHQQLLQARDRGCAILLVSTELDELLALSDRVAVLYEGRIMGTVEARQADLRELGLMMAGSVPS
ncbi:MAG: ABC transporter ATP-binding protein [Betaproteobacteria bacterium]